MSQPQPPTDIKLEDAGLATISLASRIPEFWTDQPKVWFIQLEATLAPQKLGDLPRYNILITKLGKEVIQQVTDILVNPPEVNKYEQLKERLLAIYEETESRQIQKLIGEMELGDQKPSHLLRRMQDLARGKLNDNTLSVLWQNHLPSTVRAVLAATDTRELDRLAKIADKVVESTQSQTITEIATRDAFSDVATLTAEIAKLNEKVEKLSRRAESSGRTTFRSRSQSRGRDRSVSRRTPESPDWLCRYHFRFRQRANRCEKPCSWKKPEN